ncbi:MAG: class I SAM-dependent methyltransferase [Sedimentisphaerales bacterium]|nr:class I SAM-dependent methyltransferase [Sedimentisphaerales bacterium]
MSVPRSSPGDRPTIRTQDVSCAVCGGDEAEFLFEAQDRLHDVEGSFRYVRCRQCGLVYMNPQVVPECLGSLYPREYAPHADKSGARQSGLIRFRDCIARVPVAGSLFRAVTDGRAVGPVLRRLDARKRLLDVGCGNGAFLDAMRRQTGCEVQGLDLSPAAVEQARRLYGLEVFQGTITRAPFADESFDVVTGWWYLEHVPNPQESVREMARLLKSGGLCAIGVPNCASLFARLFRDRWYHLDCPRHLCLYSPGTMRTLLARHGLSVRKIVYDKTPWGLLGSLQYRIYGDNRDPRHKNRIRQSALLWLLCLPLTLVVGVLRQSDIMTVIAEKEAKR